MLHLTISNRNERNRVLESVNDYAHRVRAEKADQMFGTNYSDTYKLLSEYTKWFNSIPLLGIGAIGVNKYFNNGTKQEK